MKGCNITCFFLSGHCSVQPTGPRHAPGLSTFAARQMGQIWQVRFHHATPSQSILHPYMDCAGDPHSPRSQVLHSNERAMVETCV